jgi:Ca2+-binding RTX toxin-like protein
MTNLIRPNASRRRTAGLMLLATAVVLAIGVGAAADHAAAAAKDDVEAKVRKGTLTVEGTNAGEEIVLRLRGGDSTILEVVTPSGVLPFSRDTFTKIAVKAGDGDDLVRIDEANGAFTNAEATTLAGEGDDDDLRGGSGAEILFGGPDDDTADGNAGADTAFLGSGDDTFTWDPGDGSDVIEGGNGSDTLIFNGADAAEVMSLSAEGSASVFLRNLGNIRMDMTSVEVLDLAALGGADTVTVDDLSGTGFRQANLDLSAIGGGGDGQADVVTVNGTDSDDQIRVKARDAQVNVDGLTPDTRLIGAETTDRLQLNALGGNNSVAVDSDAAALMDIGVEFGPSEP